MKTKFIALFITVFFFGCGLGFQLLPPNGYVATTQDVKEEVFGLALFKGGIVVAGASFRNASKDKEAVVDAGPFFFELKPSGKRTGELRLQPGERRDVVFRTYLRASQWYSIDVAVSTPGGTGTGKTTRAFTDYPNQGLQYRNFLVVNSGDGVTIY